MSEKEYKISGQRMKIQRTSSDAAIAAFVGAPTLFIVGLVAGCFLNL